MGSLLVFNALLNLWWLVPIFLVFLFLKSPLFKGWFGEVLVKLSAGLLLPGATYHAIHDVTLPTPDGTTQIDHIFVSRFGIFVVETKNMKGWIFGGEYQAQWTQKIYRKTIRFQNPLRQNYKHVKALESVLDVPPETIHSVVVFAGNSTFKTPMPDNVTMVGAYIRYIKSFCDPVLSEFEVQRIVSMIQSGCLEPSRDTRRQHIHQIKMRNNPTAGRKCSRCGSPMVLRTARRGSRVGHQFWGCSAYPKCRAVQNISDD